MIRFYKIALFILLFSSNICTSRSKYDLDFDKFELSKDKISSAGRKMLYCGDKLTMLNYRICNMTRKKYGPRKLQIRNRGQSKNIKGYYRVRNHLQHKCCVSNRCDEDEIKENCKDSLAFRYWTLINTRNFSRMG